MTDLAFADLGLQGPVIAKAQANLQAGTAFFLVVSGKQASGKDTVAPVVLSELRYTDTVHLFYAMPLKAELDAIIATLRIRFPVERYPVLSTRLKRVAADTISERFGICSEQAFVLTRDLIDAVRADPNLHARSRTPLIRFVLQYLGTDIRRAQDDLYWVRRALQPAIEELARGRSVYFTDARFPNEVDLAQRLGAAAVRLDVSAETQVERLLARDGIIPDPDALNHPSETALDDYEGFDVRLFNEGPLPEVVAKIVAGLVPARLANVG